MRRVTMKRIAAFAAMLAIGLGGVATPVLAKDAPVCLRTNYIDSTRVVDPRTILFRMKDGKVWRNSLRTPCLGLKFYGFRYETRFMEICGNAQSIRVLTTNEVCSLGNFAPEKRGTT